MGLRPVEAMPDSSCDAVEDRRHGPGFREDQSFISGCHRQAKMVCWQCCK